MTNAAKEAISIVVMTLIIILFFAGMGYLIGKDVTYTQKREEYYKGLNTHFTYTIDIIWHSIKQIKN